MRKRRFSPGPITLDSTSRPAAAAAARVLNEALASEAPIHTVSIGDAAGKGDLAIPRLLVELFAATAESLARGEALMIQPYPVEVTTQDGAELLNVSRPYLIKLLESGEIPFRKVGSHRRIVLDDLLEYKSRDDAYRRDIARELTREAEELGLGHFKDSKERKAS